MRQTFGNFSILLLSEDIVRSSFQDCHLAQQWKVVQENSRVEAVRRIEQTIHVAVQSARKNSDICLIVGKRKTLQ
jgi:hypothetical protein